MQLPSEKSMLNSKTVSFLIAAYNEEKYICEAIESCLNQSYDNIEIIITNDGSTDNTLSLINSKYGNHKSIKIFSFPINRGKVAAFNNCFQNISGDYIALMGADDISLPDRISNTISLLKKSNIEMVCGDLIKFCDNKILSRSVMYDSFGIDKDMYFDFDSLLRRPKVSGGTIIMTRKLAEKIFPVPEELKHEDWWIPLFAATHNKVYYKHTPVLKYRIHDGNEKETNLTHVDFDVWRTKSQQRKVIHYQKVISEFRLSPEQIKYVTHKKLIHELMLETRILPRLLRGFQSISLLFNDSLGSRNKLKFLAAWLAPKLAFQLSKLVYKRHMGLA
jgi:glycosyltransferase involved in cell wall biosynthesis